MIDNYNSFWSFIINYLVIRRFNHYILYLVLQQNLLILESYLIMQFERVEEGNQKGYRRSDFTDRGFSYVFWDIRWAKAQDCYIIFERTKAPFSFNYERGSINNSLIEEVDLSKDEEEVDKLCLHILEEQFSEDRKISLKALVKYLPKHVESYESNRRVIELDEIQIKLLESFGLL